MTPPDDVTRRSYDQRLHLAQLDLEGCIWHQNERDAEALAERIKVMTLEIEFAEMPDIMRERAERLLAHARRAARDIRSHRLAFEAKMARLVAVAAAQAEFDNADPEDATIN